MILFHVHSCEYHFLGLHNLHPSGCEAITQADVSGFFFFICDELSPLVYTGNLYLLFIIVNTYCLRYSLLLGLLGERCGVAVWSLLPLADQHSQPTSNDTTSSTRVFLLVAFLVKLRVDKGQELWRNMTQRREEAPCG